MKIFAALSFLLILFASKASAQSASDAANDYFEVFKNGEYAKAADFFDPTALKDFREMLDLGDALPAEAAQQFYPILFGAGSTKESVAAMNDVEFFGGFLTFVMNQAAQAGQLNFDKVEILGEVPEGEDVVHVLTRSFVSMGAMEMESMEVISFRKVDDKWMAMLSGKMKGMAAQLRSAFQQQQ